MNFSIIHRSLLMALPAWIMCSSLSAQSTLNFNVEAQSREWNSSNQIWTLYSNPTAWVDGAIANFFTGNAQTLQLTSNITASGISQERGGSHMTFNASAGQTLTLTGANMVVTAGNGSNLTFGTSLNVILSPSSSTSEQIWMVEGDGNINLLGMLSGGVGTVQEGVATGGLVKIGAGSMTLSGANTYSGVTQLKEGTLIANHATALGTSQIRFTGGVLRYGAASPAGGFASKFLALESGQSARLDTNAQNVILNQGLTGSGGLEKLGLGILTLSSGNAYSGATLVSGGVLRAAAGTGNSNPSGYIANPFGTNTAITIADGGSLDLNGNGALAGSGNTKTYEVTASGLGANGFATIYNSGSGLSNAGMISKLTFNTDISIGGPSRIDIFNVLVVGGTNTLYKKGTGEVSWISGNGANTVGDIVVEQGTFTLQATALGSSEYSVILKSGATLKAWASVSLNKKLTSYGNAEISLSGSSVSATNNNEATFNLNHAVTLSGGTTKFAANTGYRQGYYHQAIGGTGNLSFTGTTSASLLTEGQKQTATHFLKGSGSNFVGDVLVQNSVLRLSDPSLASGMGGALGATSNKLTLETGSGDQYANLDLHGTTQTIGALVSAGAGTSRIQNRRAGSTATLKVGQGGAGGTFAGILEDYTATFHGKAITTDGNTGKLAFEKLGAGTQILTGVNTFTGGLSVRAGRLQIGSGATGTSTAKAGNSAFTVLSGATLSGNGTVGTASLANSILSGGKLEVGTIDQTAAQTLFLSGSLSSQGTLSFDIFNATLGSGNTTHNDTLSFVDNRLIDVDGILEVTDKSSTSSTWTAGTWFRLFDWTNVSTESLRDVTFTQWLLPTLGANLMWDTSQLTSTGRITVSSVPEPERLLLGVLGGLGLVLRRRR